MRPADVWKILAVASLGRLPRARIQHLDLGEPQETTTLRITLRIIVGMRHREQSADTIVFRVTRNDLH